jgi:hypothetical protein
MVGKLGCGCCQTKPGNDDPPTYNGCNCLPYFERNNYQWGHDLTSGNQLPSSIFFLNQNSGHIVDITRWFRQSRFYQYPTNGFNPYVHISGLSGFVQSQGWNAGFSLRENWFANQVALNERNYEYKISVTTLQQYSPFYFWTGTAPAMPARTAYYGLGESKLSFTVSGQNNQTQISHGVVLKLPLPSMPFAGLYPLAGPPKLYYTIWSPSFGEAQTLTFLRVPLYEIEIPWGTHELGMKIKSAPFSYPSTPQIFIEMKLNGSTVYQQELTNVSNYFNWIKCTATPDYWRYLSCLRMDYGNLYLPASAFLPGSPDSEFIYQTNPQDTRYWDDLVFDPQFKA